MRVLALDSSQGFDLAIDDNGTTHLLRQGALPKVEALLTDLQAALTAQDLQPRDIDRLVVVTGPGNYTTLRAGIVALRTWGMVQQLPLFVTGRLDMMLYAASLEHPEQLYAPCLNVKQGQWYAAMGQWSMGQSNYLQAPGLWRWEDWVTEVQKHPALSLLHLEPLPESSIAQRHLPQIVAVAARWGALQALEKQAFIHQVQPFYIRPAVNITTHH
jgi:tRNA threonylcarbamoyl adenosine modification protein YeaZ